MIGQLVKLKRFGQTLITWNFLTACGSTIFLTNFTSRKSCKEISPHLPKI